MSKNSIKINGDKLRTLLEERTGLTIYQIAQINGFSRNLIAESIRKEIASPIVQMIADKCGVNTEEYIYKEPITAPERTQISIDDYESIKRSELLELIKEAIIELVNETEVRAYTDPLKQETRFYFKKKEA